MFWVWFNKNKNFCLGHSYSKYLNKKDKDIYFERQHTFSLFKEANISFKLLIKVYFRNLWQTRILTPKLDKMDKKICHFRRTEVKIFDPSGFLKYYAIPKTSFFIEGRMFYPNSFDCGENLLSKLRIGDKGTRSKVLNIFEL